MVEGGFSASAEDRGRPITNLSFQMDAIGAPDLGARVSKVEIFDGDGKALSFRRLQPGEFVLDVAKNDGRQTLSSFRYEVDLRPPPDRRSAAHTSWLTTDSGLLFPKDILPLRNWSASANAVIKLELPAGWGKATTLNDVHGSMMSFRASDEVILIGPRIRERRKDRTMLATGDTWQFSDENALRVSSEILDAYRDNFGAYSSQEPLVLLVRFPQANVPKGVWEAETRGRTVVIASSDMPFEGQAMQRLSEQLRHEIFHLWFPNGVNFTGRYDWFYEGFALYQSLKTGVALNQISFNDLLDTLSRAHTIDNASSAGRLSLIEASSARWSGLEAQVYARGMLVAFLCDLALLRDSKGKRSLETLSRQLFAYALRKYDALPEDGNTAILRMFDQEPGLQPITKDYIRGNSRVDLEPLIAEAGLEKEASAAVTRLRVASSLTGKQKTLLDKLGYNSWRKLTKK